MVSAADYSREESTGLKGPRLSQHIAARIHYARLLNEEFLPEFTLVPLLKSKVCVNKNCAGLLSLAEFRFRILGNLYRTAIVKLHILLSFLSAKLLVVQLLHL